ncbi:MAG: lysoplasmalogenase [Chloroflexi bacterium]|nr:lysoplasmalogenase [Chloroflexota bacterium]
MSDWLQPAVLALIGLATFANWIAIWKGKLTTYYATKPLVMLGLITYFLLQGSITTFRLPFLLGLIFSLIGDIFLISQRTRWFVAGMAAFSAAQVFYIWGFNASLPPRPVRLIGIVALVAGMLILHLTVNRLGQQPRINKAILPFFKGYGTLILGMAISAVLCLARPTWPDLAAVMAGTGGILFLISDVMIGLDKLDRRLPKYKFWIIFSYHLAQFLIVAAVLRVAA